MIGACASAGEGVRTRRMGRSGEVRGKLTCPALAQHFCQAAGLETRPSPLTVAPTAHPQHPAAASAPACSHRRPIGAAGIELRRTRGVGTHCLRWELSMIRGRNGERPRRQRRTRPDRAPDDPNGCVGGVSRRSRTTRKPGQLQLALQAVPPNALIRRRSARARLLSPRYRSISTSTSVKLNENSGPRVREPLPRGTRSAMVWVRRRCGRTRARACPMW